MQITLVCFVEQDTAFYSIYCKQETSQSSLLIKIDHRLQGTGFYSGAAKSYIRSLQLPVLHLPAHDAEFTSCAKLPVEHFAPWQRS